MPDTIYGFRGTGNILQDRRVRDVADKIALLEPSEAPYTTLLLKLGEKRKCFSPKVEWLEDQLIPRWDNIDHPGGTGSAYAADAASVRFANPYISPNDILLYPLSGERLRVTAFDTATRIAAISRGWGGTTPAEIPHGASIQILGNAAEEGSQSQTALTTKETPQYNYVQIIKTPIQLTEVEEASKLYGGPDRAYQQKKGMIQHKVDLERALLFGVKAESAGAGGHNVRTMGGAMSFISTNVQDAGGVFTEFEMESFLEQLFQYGSDERLALCSARALSVINSWAKDKIRINDSASKRYGLAISEYISPHGRLAVVKHRLLTGSVYGGYIVFIDPANVRYCYLDGLDTKLYENIQEADRAGFKDEIRTYASLEVKLEKTHGLIHGITG